MTKAAAKTRRPRGSITDGKKPSELEPTLTKPTELLWLPPSSLNPWPDNPRKNDGEPVARVKRSIKKFGFGAPIVARMANYEIIAGHTRWKAATELKLSVVPVCLLDLNEDDAHTLALADNRLTELTDWDGSLAAVLGRLKPTDAALAGWTEEQVAAVQKKFGAIDEPAEDESSKTKTEFAVLLPCADEQEQLRILAECERLGWECRALT